MYQTCTDLQFPHLVLTNVLQIICITLQRHSVYELEDLFTTSTTFQHNICYQFVTCLIYDKVKKGVSSSNYFANLQPYACVWMWQPQQCVTTHKDFLHTHKKITIVLWQSVIVVICKSTKIHLHSRQFNLIKYK